MLGGFCFSVNSATVTTIVTAAVSFVFLGAILCFRHLLRGKHIITSIATIAFIISLLLGFLFNSLYFPHKYYGKEVSVEALVTEADYTEKSYSTLTIKTSKIDSKSAIHSIPFTCGKDELAGVNVGDKITATVTFSEIDDDDNKTYWLSKGYSADGDEINNVTVISRGNKTLDIFFAEMRCDVCDRIRNVSDKTTGDFLSALLTGERTVTPPSVKLSFARTGTTHILALSGAHLVILAYAISLLLKLFPINNKIRTAIIALAVIFYVYFTGMSASVVRSGVMLLISSVIYLLAHKSDGPTTLALSVALIICMEPNAIFDIALWLSAFATLGLLFLSSVMKKPENDAPIPKKLLHSLLTAILASVFAISASTVISFFFFDSFSVLAVPTTLALSFLTEALIYLTLLGMIFGSIIPFNPLLVWLTELCFDIADWFSRFEHALISYDFVFVRILSVLLILGFFSLLIFSDKRMQKVTVVAITVLFVLMNGVGLIQSTVNKNEDAIIYTSGDNANAVTVKSDGECSLILAGGGKYDKYSTVSVANGEKLTYIDRLVIPSYTYYTYDTVLTTVANIYVDTLYLPAPMVLDEIDTAYAIEDLLEEFDTDIVYFELGEQLSLGRCTFTLHAISQPASSNRYNAYSVTDGDTVVLYMSPDCFDSLFNPAMEEFNTADVIIVGGKKNADKTTLSMAPKGVKTVILGGNYRLSDETESYFNKKGVSVKYTDTPIEIN